MICRIFHYPVLAHTPHTLALPYAELSLATPRPPPGTLFLRVPWVLRLSLLPFLDFLPLRVAILGPHAPPGRFVFAASPIGCKVFLVHLPLFYLRVAGSRGFHAPTLMPFGLYDGYSLLHSVALVGCLRSWLEVKCHFLLAAFE